MRPVLKDIPGYANQAHQRSRPRRRLHYPDGGKLVISARSRHRRHHATASGPFDITRSVGLRKVNFTRKGFKAGFFTTFER